MFLDNIKSTYGTKAQFLIKRWLDLQRDINRNSQRKDFLINCRHHNLFPKHIKNIVNNISNMYIFIVYQQESNIFQFLEMSISIKKS